MGKDESFVQTTVAHYRILQKIGQGGMGEVYLAEDSRLFRKVALKILPSEFTKEPDRLRRFQTEARAASALNHPNILIVHDIGQTGEVHYIATEYVEGKTLRSRLKSGKQSTAEALEIAIQIISALASAHESGIVHRDIKPENIMIRPDGYVKVLDFGLAKVIQTGEPTDVTDAETVTTTGYMMGTLKYMSPEQVRGFPVDARSDIFSVGVLLYEMVAGVHPFEARTTGDFIAAILEKDPLPLSNYSENVPEEMERIIYKMLQKNREDRYQTARDLLNDLKLFKHRLEVSNRSTHGEPAKTKKSLDLRAPQISYKIILGIVAAIFLIAFGLYQLKKSTARINSIAVLPLLNVGEEPEMEYLTDGITETIIRTLSQLPNLKVMAQSTVFQYKKREVDPQTVGKELGVQAVMTGKVIYRGEDILITIELADARNNGYLWSHQYHQKASNLLSTQDDIATDICQRLRFQLSGEEKKLITKRYTDNVEAYQLYLKGRYFWNKRTKDGIEKGISYFQQALDTDPSYGLAWSGLADSYIAQTFYNYAAPKEGMPKAKAAAMRALSIDVSLAEAHITLGHVAANFDWDWATSEKRFKQGMELNPNYPTGHQWYALHYLIPNVRLDEALSELKRAQDLDPLSPLMTTFLGETLYFARRYQEAEKQCQKALELQPNFHVAHWHLGMIYEQEGKYEQAISEHEKAVEFSGGSPRLIAAFGHALALAGKSENALQVIAQLDQISKHGYVSPFELSTIYVALGKNERAFELLDDAYNERSLGITWLKVRPEFDPIRKDPRFVNLIRRIGLQP